MNSGQNTEASGSQSGGSFSELFHTWRYFFWLLCLVALVMLFYAEENWRGQRAWEKHKREMRTRGEQFEASAFIPASVPDEENFATTRYLEPLFSFLAGTQHWRSTNALANDQDFIARYNAASSLIHAKKGPRSNSWVKSRTDLVEWDMAFVQSTNDAMHRKEQVIKTKFTVQRAAAGVLAALSENEPVLEEIRVASHRPYCRFNIHYQEDNPAGILLPHLVVLKHISQVLQLRASAELALKKTDAAFEDVNLMLFLADASRSEPILISQLVRLAQLQLALQPLGEGIGQWSESQLRDLQERLQGFDFCGDSKRTLQAERVLFGSGMIEYVRRSRDKLNLMSELGGAAGGQEGGLELVGALMATAPSGWLYFEQLNHSLVFEEDFLPTIDLPNREIRPEASRKAEESLMALGRSSPPVQFLRHRFFSGLLLPSISKVVQKTAFAQTSVDAAALACALERYRLAQGQFAESLDALTPRFMAKPPHDIVNGEPLKYRRSADGQYVLYSVGWNAKDDGGVVGMTKSDEGVDFKEGDWVWRGVGESD